MEDIKEDQEYDVFIDDGDDDVINEDNEIIDYEMYKKMINNETKKCICKIYIKIQTKQGIKAKTGSGFFCNIPSKNLKVLITNNHVLDEEYIYKKENISIEVDKIKYEINLKNNRYKYTNEELDFTIIEILLEDNIKNYLEIDEFIELKDYEEEQIFCLQFPKGGKLSYSNGRIMKKEDEINKYLKYSLGTKSGSSGSPLMLTDNLKVIGIHKGRSKKDESICIGIPIKYIIDKINFIKCVYNIDEEHVGKEIQILNNQNNWKKNYEIENEIEVLINGEIKSCFFSL